MDGTIRIWDVCQGLQLHALKRHRGWISAGAFAAGGRLPLSASEDHYVKVWDLIRGVSICDYWVGAQARAIVTDPRSSLVAVGDAAGRVHVLELAATGYGRVDS
jgi:WD40 repeat protein